MCNVKLLYHILIVVIINFGFHFDIFLSSRFEKVSRIVGMSACPTSMTVSTDMPYPYEMVFIWGDDRGGITAIFFNDSPLVTAINPKRAKHLARENVTIQDLLSGKMKHLKCIHYPSVHCASVEKVIYAPVSVWVRVCTGSVCVAGGGVCVCDGWRGVCVCREWVGGGGRC